VGRFHLTSHSRLSLLAALLDVLAVEDKLIPVDSTAFED
jgi:hypothetical protein